jgi:membrane-associated phospholipid phosphatase
MIAFFVALLLDAPIAGWVHSTGIAYHVQHGRWWPKILKAPGDFRFNLIVAFLLVIVRQIHWKQGVFVVCAGVMSGLNSPLKWIVGRYRPFHPDPRQLRPFHLEPFWHGLHGLFHQGPLSFPSGHECTAFALAAALLVVWPRGGWIFVIVAFVTGLERIAENAHYPSDVVGAVGFSMLCVMLLNRLPIWERNPCPV